jgi:Zn-dependent membrane protease YugP
MPAAQNVLKAAAYAYVAAAALIDVARWVTVLRF